MDNRLLYRFILSAAIMLTAAGSMAAKPIKALIVTGQNNHNWQVSHDVLKRILENSGLFAVDPAVTPPQGGDMSVFTPDFSQYALVVLDYNGDRWPGETEERFLEYVRGGGGVVVFHAANNAFPDWPEYNLVTALGGWGGRDEKSGPYLYIKDGELITDNSPGPGGSHGPAHEYVLRVRNDRHPIVKGLPVEWLHCTDELYDRTRGPANVGDILYTAYSSPEKNGTGHDELLIFTVEYGKGRIFHTMLGHTGPTAEESPALQCTGFQVTLLRGAEWAATGKVKQKAPEDFPTATRASMRKDFR